MQRKATKAGTAPGAAEGEGALRKRQSPDVLLSGACVPTGNLGSSCYIEQIVSTLCASLSSSLQWGLKWSFCSRNVHVGCGLVKWVQPKEGSLEKNLFAYRWQRGGTNTTQSRHGSARSRAGVRRQKGGASLGQSLYWRFWGKRRAGQGKQFKNGQSE